MPLLFFFFFVVVVFVVVVVVGGGGGGVWACSLVSANVTCICFLNSEKDCTQLSCCDYTYFQ